MSKEFSFSFELHWWWNSRYFLNLPATETGANRIEACRELVNFTDMKTKNGEETSTQKNNLVNPEQPVNTTKDLPKNYFAPFSRVRAISVQSGSTSIKLLHGW